MLSKMGEGAGVLENKGSRQQGYRRWMGVLLAAGLMTGCVGTQTTSSSDGGANSSASVMSMSSSNSSSSQSTVLNGEQTYSENCSACHGDFDGGVSDGSVSVIDVNNFQFDTKFNGVYAETVAGLAQYIVDQMPPPPSSPTSCGNDCAQVVGQYLWSLRGSSTVSNFSAFMANADTGKTIFENTCTGSNCHGTEGRGQNAVNFAGYQSASDFHVYIEPRMPKADPAECKEQCSADVSAYLWSVRPVETSCSSDTDILFAQRALPLLTPLQYKYSIQDIFLSFSANAVVPENYLKAPDANYVGSFPHTLKKQVSEDGSAKQLFDNAVAIADWNNLPSNEFVSCSTNTAAACASEFIDGFARMAFRRPLKTQAAAGEDFSEVEYFNRIFQEAPTVAEGIKWAVVGALNSPQFLYRSELGMKVSEAINDPFFNGDGGGSNASANPNDYEVVGNAVRINGVDFTTKEAEAGGGVGAVSPDANTTFKLYTNGSLKHSLSAASPSLLTVRVRGNDFNGVWPDMNVSFNGELLGSHTVESPNYANDYQDFTYVVLGMAGAGELQIYFGNDAGATGAMGEPGTDVDLHVAYAEISAAQLIAQNDGDTEGSFSDDLASLASDSGAYVLDAYEYAAALSYMITGSTPDQALLAAAANGSLNARAGVETQIDRLFASSRAERHMKDFVGLWMQNQDIDKNKALEALDADIDLRDLMLEELQEFFWYIVSNADVPFSDFYAADYTFLNKRLAEHYSIPWSGTNESEFVKTTLPANQKRGGIVTMGAFLAAHAHNEGSAPIFRGVHVREDLLCHHIIPPGSIDEEPGIRDQKQVLADAAKADGSLTTRRYFEIATLSEGPNDGCGICHYYDINPVGATMEDFDGFGRYRTEQLPEGADISAALVAVDATSGGLDKDTSEGIRGLEDFKNYDQTSVPINGARELSLSLSQTDAVQSCFVEKVFRSALSRPIKNTAIDTNNVSTDVVLNEFEAESFACANDQLKRVFSASGQDPKILFRELGNLSLMRFRRQ